LGKRDQYFCDMCGSTFYTQAMIPLANGSYSIIKKNQTLKLELCAACWNSFSIFEEACETRSSHDYCTNTDTEAQ